MKRYKEQKAIERNKKRNNDNNEEWLTMIREYASSLSLKKLTRQKVDYNYFEDEQDEADAEDYVMTDNNFIDIFTQSIEDDFFDKWQPLQIKEIITDP